MRRCVEIPVVPDRASLVLPDWRGYNDDRLHGSATIRLSDYVYLMDDCLIIGGGVIGLSLAYELSGRGLTVRLVERGQMGREASWAGAGILPPGGKQGNDRPIDQLTALSCRLHPQWANQLREETGIDTGYRRCGGIYVARGPAEAATLAELVTDARRRAIEVDELSASQLADLEPALADDGKMLAACHLPEEAQIRNPRHLKALLAACVRRGVRLNTGTSVHRFDVSDGRITAARTNAGVFQAERYCLTAGCWSRALLEDLQTPLAVKPVRGQIVLLQSQPGRLTRIINQGPRYLVPRPDGRVLIGSTEDDVGFDRRTTSEGISSLLRFALELAPGLADAEVERTWAGLRPATPNRLPILGQLPHLENAFVATGHFRAGLQLSAATAVVMSQLIRGEQPEIDLKPFCPSQSGRADRLV